MALYDVGRVIVGGFFRLFFRVKITGRENIPDVNKRFVICANHKSNLDPPLVGWAMPFEIGYMAKEELFHNKLFGALITKLGAFPIKRGKSDVSALRTAISLVKDGKHIVVFPEGGRSHNDRLRKGKMGAAMVAVKAKADILPVGIEGGYKPFGRINVNIGKPIDLSGYHDKKLESGELQDITDRLLMPTISELSHIPMNKQQSIGGSEDNGHNNS